MANFNDLVVTWALARAPHTYIHYRNEYKLLLTEIVVRKFIVRFISTFLVFPIRICVEAVSKFLFISKHVYLLNRLILFF